MSANFLGKATAATCPFCGIGISVDTCPIVATNYRQTDAGRMAGVPGVGGVFSADLESQVAAAGSATDGGAEAGHSVATMLPPKQGPRPVSGSDSLGQHGEYPVLARPPWGADEFLPSRLQCRQP